MKKNDFKIDFICVGAPKSGTTWLYFCLKQHPEISMPDRKEIDFFNKTKIFYSKNKDWNYKKGFDWYKSFFKQYNSGKLVGEFSVNYLADKETPKLISRHYPKAKIIMILRNPVDRFYSHYQYAKAKNKINNKEDDDANIKKIVNEEKEFLRIGYYDLHIKNYQKYFSNEQLLILLYDELVENKNILLKKVYNFLDINDNFKPSVLNKKINTTISKIYNYPSVPFYHHKNIINAMKGITKKTILKSKKPKYKQISSESRKILLKQYFKHINKLESILNINLRNWKK